MLKRILSPLLILVLLLFAVSSGYAVIRGLENDQQSIVKIGENVIVPKGAEIRSVVAVGGSVTVSGHVIQDVVAVGGSVFLKDTAMVGGDVVSIGGKIVKDPGAITKGDIVEVAVAGVAPAVSFFAKGGILKGFALFGLFSFVGFIILTIILVALFTPQLGKVSASLEKSLSKNFWIGTLIIVLFVPMVVVLAVSIVGIILIPLWVMVVTAAGLFGYIAVGHLLGKKTLQAFRITGRSMMVETLAGVILLCLVGFVPIAGYVAKMVALLCGLGGIYQTRFGTR